MKKTWMGILSFAPIVLLGISIVILLLGVFGLAVDEESILGLIVVFASYGGIFLAVILTYVDIIWFIVLTVKSRKLDSGKKVLWGILLYCFNVFVFPVFWWMFIRQDDAL